MTCIKAVFKNGLAFVVLSGNLLAQSTWHDLRFGMTESEAKLKLGGVAKRPVSVPEQRQSFQADYAGWVVPIEVEEIEGQGLISFDKVTHRLVGVTLVLDSEKLRDTSDKQWVKRVRRSLEDEYGKPFRIEGRGGIDTRTTWRLKDQIVELQALETSDGGSQLVFIDYKLPTSKL